MDITATPATSASFATTSHGSPVRKLLVIGVLAALFLGGVGALAWSLFKPAPNPKDLVEDPKVAQAIFYANRGLRPGGMSPAVRMPGMGVRRLADGVDRRMGAVTVRQGGITAEVTRRRGAAGEVDVVLGYNGAEHPGERVWLLLRDQLLNGRGPTLNPVLSESQLGTLRDLAPSPSLVSAPDVTQKIGALCKGLIGGRNAAGAATTPPDQLDAQLLAALSQLPADARQKLMDDFIRRANGVRDALGPEQRAQVQLELGIP